MAEVKMTRDSLRFAALRKQPSQRGRADRPAESCADLSPAFRLYTRSCRRKARPTTPSASYPYKLAERFLIVTSHTSGPDRGGQNPPGARGAAGGQGLILLAPGRPQIGPSCREGSGVALDLLRCNWEQAAGAEDVCL